MATARSPNNLVVQAHARTRGNERLQVTRRSGFAKRSGAGKNSRTPHAAGFCKPCHSAGNISEQRTTNITERTKMEKNITNDQPVLLTAAEAQMAAATTLAPFNRWATASTA
jgi:hypothetical protein